MAPRSPHAPGARPPVPSVRADHPEAALDRDPRIARFLEAAALIARGRHTVHVHPPGDDDVARLGWAIDGLGHRLERLHEELRRHQEVLDARARTESLLHEVLPAPIARRLGSGEAVIADQVDAATVVFADIAGFSALAARVPPDVLVRFLDGYFSHLDRLAEARGVEKIKTIGDAWLAAAGVPRPRADHAAAACDLALEVLEAARAHPRPDGAPLRVRVGLHAGPVVAGVIGRSRLVYDLWGDTVNVARRMESEGEPGRVQVTAAVLAAAGGAFRGAARGAVAMKGGGAVDGFWLERA